ncbi:MAG TPA: type II secretion system protein [Gemmatimonadaceae bacterium]|nr:type II secretion system protein [Gemmatimonadaceae bacterium]
MRIRTGTTLIELLVVIALLGIIGTVAAVSLRAPATRAASDASIRLAAIRDSAVRTGRPVTTVWIVAGTASAATAYPDGRVIDERPDRASPLSGRMSVRAR